MRSLSDAYLKGDARAFFDAHPSDAEHRRRLVDRVARPLHPAVAHELEAQNARYAASPSRDANLSLLRRGAAAVVTGQQTGLFLGPLYTLYKAAAAIRNAQQLARETGRPVVPVFWLQTEDHDLPEIACCDVPAWGDAPCSLRLDAPAESRVSVAHLRLPPEVSGCLAELSTRVGSLPHGAAHLAMLGRHYRAGAGWTAAFAGLLAELFANEGLVLLDPRTPAIAAAAAPVHRRALVDAGPIAERLLERCTRLTEAGFSPSVHVREGAPLSFFHPAGVEGPRYRLEPAAGGFAEVGGSGVHTREALLGLLEKEPLRFSSSALLRPIVQDFVLPTVAYVGGPGEIAYFAQLAPLYAFFERPMPVIVPRARFRLIEPRAAQALRRLDLTPDSVERADEAVLPGAAPNDELERLYGAFDAALEELTARVLAADPQLSTPVRKTRSTVRRAVAKLRRKQAATNPELRALRAALAPRGAPQERVFGLSHYAALVGERALIERLVAAVEPFEGQLRDLFL